MKRASQHVAFGAIVVDHAQAAVLAFILRCERFAHLGDIGKLTFYDRFAMDVRDLDIDLIDRIKRIEVSARLAVRDFLCGAFFDARANVAQLGDAAVARDAREFGH